MMSEEDDDVKKQEAATRVFEEDDDDVMSQVVKKQEAALRKLEMKHGPGYGKPPAGSKSEARAVKYNVQCAREFLSSHIFHNKLSFAWQRKYF